MPEHLVLGARPSVGFNESCLGKGLLHGNAVFIATDCSHTCCQLAEGQPGFGSVRPVSQAICSQLEIKEHLKVLDSFRGGLGCEWGIPLWLNKNSCINQYGLYLWCVPSTDVYHIPGAAAVQKVSQWQPSGRRYSMQIQEVLGESNDVLLGCERDIDNGL